MGYNKTKKGYKKAKKKYNKTKIKKTSKKGGVDKDLSKEIAKLERYLHNNRIVNTKEEAQAKAKAEAEEERIKALEIHGNLDELDGGKKSNKKKYNKNKIKKNSKRGGSEEGHQARAEIIEIIVNNPELRPAAARQSLEHVIKILDNPENSDLEYGDVGHFRKIVEKIDEKLNNLIPNTSNYKKVKEAYLKAKEAYDTVAARWALHLRQEEEAYS